MMKIYRVIYHYLDIDVVKTYEVERYGNEALKYAGAVMEHGLRINTKNSIVLIPAHRILKIDLIETA